MDTHASLLEAYSKLVEACKDHKTMAPARFKELLEEADDTEAYFRVWLDGGRPPLFSDQHALEHMYVQYMEHVPVCGMPAQTHSNLCKSMLGCSGDSRPHYDHAGQLMCVYTPAEYTQRFASELWVRCTEFLRFIGNAPSSMR